MRIISGQLKGKKLIHINNNTTRPLRDMVKESIFNIINHSNFINIEIKDSLILDLYSGTGSFGIECLSRGAAKVIFVENNKLALEILKKNIKNASIIDKVEIKSKSAELYINQHKGDVKYDLFFFDPPFADQKYKDILKKIKELKLYKKEHLLVFHREQDDIEELKKIIKIIEIKIYGRSKVFFAVFN